MPNGSWPKEREKKIKTVQHFFILIHCPGKGTFYNKGHFKPRLQRNMPCSQYSKPSAECTPLEERSETVHIQFWCCQTEVNALDNREPSIQSSMPKSPCLTLSLMDSLELCCTKTAYSIHTNFSVPPKWTPASNTQILHKTAQSVGTLDYWMSV